MNLFEIFNTWINKINLFEFKTLDRCPIFKKNFSLFETGNSIKNEKKKNPPKIEKRTTGCKCVSSKLSLKCLNDNEEFAYIFLISFFIHLSLSLSIQLLLLGFLLELWFFQLLFYFYIKYLFKKLKISNLEQQQPLNQPSLLSVFFFFVFFFCQLF